MGNGNGGGNANKKSYLSALTSGLSAARRK
jgi:hypothetical protein